MYKYYIKIYQFKCLIVTDKSQSTISHHLRKLERAELIYSFRKGNYTHYGLIKERLEEYIEVFNNEINTIINELNIVC